MKRHIKEKELIQYQFKLASDVRLEKTAEHLQSCAQCRENLEQLKRKFAALDLLREETKVSEDLISQVIEQAKQPIRTRTIWLRKPAWIGAAAAVLLVGLLLVTYLNRQTMPNLEFVKEPKPSAESKLGERTEVVKAMDSYKKDALEKTFAPAAPKGKKPEAMDDGRRPTDKSSLVSRVSSIGQIAEKPPFAPAGAIELVVLPRREKVQLTIYNSTSETWRGDNSSHSDFSGSDRSNPHDDYGEYEQRNDQPSDLITIIQETIEPYSWFDYGGEGTIEIYDNKKLVVLQTAQIHRKIEKLLEVLKAGLHEQVKGESSILIDQDSTDSAIYKQLDQIVDLSELKPTMPFGEAIEILKRSVEPPLNNIVVLWRDLLEMAEIKPTTEINMDGLPSVRLGTGLEKLLKAVAGGYAELGYIVEDGVITIATLESLPSKMETRVYNISDLGGVSLDGHRGSGSAAGTSVSGKLAVKEIKKEQDLRRHFDPRSPAKTPVNGLTLVQERRNLTLKQGWNWLQFMWANTLIDPTSLSLEPLEQKDKIYVQQLVFPPQGRELGRWLIHSEVSSQVPFEITYFTSGLSWRAFYMGTLAQDEKTMRLQGYVRITNNSGEDYENAQTRLIVGKVHLLDQIAELAKRQYPYDRPVVIEEDEKDQLKQTIIRREIGGYGGMGGYGAALDFRALRPKEIVKEGLSEYFLYTIEGTETIADKWGKRLLSFEAEDIPVKSLYKYDEDRWGKQTIRFVSFANDQEHNLGNTPIPDGSIKIYSQVDEQGYLSYVGGTDIKYIPVNEEIELNLGTARLVSVEPVLMDYKKDNFVFDRRGNISGWDEIQTWKLKIANTRTLPIEIEITRRIDAPYWTLQADIPYEKYDARRVRFEINLEPRSKRTFEYTVRMYHGERKEVLTKQK